MFFILFIYIELLVMFYKDCFTLVSWILYCTVINQYYFLIHYFVIVSILVYMLEMMLSTYL